LLPLPSESFKLSWESLSSAAPMTVIEVAPPTPTAPPPAAATVVEATFLSAIASTLMSFAAFSFASPPTLASRLFRTMFISAEAPTPTAPTAADPPKPVNATVSVAATFID